MSQELPRLKFSNNKKTFIFEKQNEPLQTKQVITNLNTTTRSIMPNDEG